MAFQGKIKRGSQQLPSPEELYLSGALPRTTDAVDSLWLHQGDVIRAYAQDHQSTADLALELPTGTGKTLPGLLIGEWVRRKGEGPVIYATPTKQLDRQVAATAEREGMPGVLLIGSAKYWDAIDETAVEGGEAIGITTYSSVFNSSPKLPEPRLLIFDDAHAGEQFVGNEYGVTIRRYDNESAYLGILQTLKPFLSGLLIQRLEGAPDPGAHHQVRLILPAVDSTALAKLDTALAALPGSFAYDFAMIRSGLSACCVYLSYGGIQIRPMIPPTFENRVFARAKQRIYLSATLGSGGELERAFGRREIVRMPLPTKTPPRSGRRLRGSTRGCLRWMGVVGPWSLMASTRGSRSTSRLIRHSCWVRRTRSPLSQIGSIAGSLSSCRMTRRTCHRIRPRWHVRPCSSWNLSNHRWNCSRTSPASSVSAFALTTRPPMEAGTCAHGGCATPCRDCTTACLFCRGSALHAWSMGHASTG